jgi:hypothetical protein
LLLLLLACAPAIEDLAIEFPGDVGTVAIVRWTTPQPTDALVEVGEDTTYGRTVLGWSSDAGTEHAVLLAGLAGGLDWHWRVTGTGPDADVDHVFHTAPPPRALGQFRADTFDPDRASGGYTILTLAALPSMAVILDAEGRVVWWKEVDDDLFVSQARLSADGRDVILLVGDNAHQVDVGEIVRYPLAGGDPVHLTAPNGHHDFVERADGGLGFLAVDIRSYDGVDVGGDTLMEMDGDGTGLHAVWSTWDWLVPGPTEWMVPFYGGALDWTHCNGLALDEAEDTWLVSAHALDAVFAVDRATGALDWQLGGEGSDFALSSGDAFHSQHGPSFVPGGVLLFDNRKADVDNLYSRAVEYGVDPVAGTFTERWSYAGDRTLYSPFLGDTERLPNGNTLVGWGAAGRVSEVTPDGEAVWQVDAPMGWPPGFAHHLDTLGGVP